MRILYIHQYFCTRSGKSGTRSYEFAKHLVRNGHKVTMLTSTSDLSDVEVPPGKRFHRYSVDGINVLAVRVGYSQGMSTIRRIWSFLQFMLLSTLVACRQKRQDVVFATSTPLTVGVPGVCASLALRVPFVFEARDLWPEAPIQMGVIRNPILIRLLRFFERFVYARSNHVVALSPGTRNGIIAAGVSPSRVSVIPNCSDLDLFHPGPPDPDIVQRHDLAGRFVAIHAGSMGAVNGLHTAVDAAKWLQDEGHDDVVILLLGQGGEEAQLRSRVDSLKLRNLLMIKSVPRYQVADYLRSSQVSLVLVRNIPFLANHSANKLFDGLAAGRPIIVNCGGWTRDLVQRYHVGRYSIPGSGESLARQILWLRDHPQACEQMGGNARKLAETEFARNVLAARFEQILQDAVARKVIEVVRGSGPGWPAQGEGQNVARAHGVAEAEKPIQAESGNSASPGGVPEFEGRSC